MAFLLIPIFLLIAMVFEALSFTAMASVFFDLPLWDGWHAAWDRPGWLLVFALLTLIFSTRRTR